MLSNGIPSDSYQVGDCVIYTKYSKPEPGTITRVHLTRSDDTPDAVEIYRYDIHLDARGNLIRVHEHIKRAERQ